MTRTKRWVFAIFGILLVLIGALGVILPGLPATVFLLGASWCFARSWPWLEERLLRNRFFAPYLRYLDGNQSMTTRARIVTIAIIWVAVGISMASLHAQDVLARSGATALVGAALIGSFVVWRFRRGRPSRGGQNDGDSSPLAPGRVEGDGSVEVVDDAFDDRQP